MKSTAQSIEQYLTEIPENRLKAFEKLLKICRKYLPDHEENMSYNMPSFVRNGQVEVALASQKQHLVIYFLIHEVMLNNKDRLRGLDHGKGAIRYSNPDKIDYDVIRLLLEETNKSDTTIC